jgi:hypothetical protein
MNINITSATRARTHAGYWATAWVVVVVAFALAVPLARGGITTQWLFVPVLVAYGVGVVSIASTQRALSNDTFIAWLPIYGPLSLMAVDDRFNHLPIPPPRFSLTAGLFVFAPIWSFVIGVHAVGDNGSFLATDDNVIATLIACVIVAASRVIIAMRVRAVLDAVITQSNAERIRAAHAESVAG